jgi:hypothetical protein
MAVFLRYVLQPCRVRGKHLVSGGCLRPWHRKRTGVVTDRNAPTLSRSTSEEPIVLLIDDDLALCEALGRLIRSVGRRVETYNSAQAFL